MKITISISSNFDSGGFRLMVTSYNMTAPAGPRLFRAPPHPSIAFGEYATGEAAEADRTKLQAYLDALPPPKKQRKARGAFED